LETAASAPVRARIFDAGGRTVRDLGWFPGDGGRPRWTWDGRDAAGRMLPAGLYFMSCRGAGLEQTAPLLRLK
jgi:hypothetical protein